MERPSKLADLTLVSKYYPVANYSYPRKDGSRSSSPTHRSSLGSEGSAPGLVDDDSEASFDDDYQYNSHASEIWDTFWQPESFKCEEDVHPKKQYPALLPSPYHRRDHADISSRRGAAWPLPESPCQQSRKPAAAYSPFPKPIALPPRSTSLVPSWTNSRSQEKPQRPPRPDSRIVRSYLTPRSPITSAFAAADISTSRPITRPLTPSEPRPRVISPLEPRPATSCGNRAPSPSCGSTNTIILVQPSPGLPSPAFQFPVPPPAQERPLPARPPMLDLSAQELKSFFDHDDSDDEEGQPESTPRFKFLFHKRSESDSKRTTESHPAPPKTRNRAKTAPSSPSGEHPLACEETSKSSSQGKKRQGDYFHRMLGRRSR